MDAVTHRQGAARIAARFDERNRRVRAECDVRKIEPIGRGREPAELARKGRGLLQQQQPAVGSEGDGAVDDPARRHNLGSTVERGAGVNAPEETNSKPPLPTAVPTAVPLTTFSVPPLETDTPCTV